MQESNKTRAERYLLELTSLPTATAREDRVVAWLEGWAKRRKNVDLQRDRYGNLLIQRRGVTTDRPIVFAAHMDHPAFVVTAVEGKTVTAEFRGGVRDEYFVGTKVRLWHEGRSSRHSSPGVVEAMSPGEAATPREASGFKIAKVGFRSPPPARPGDVMTWDLGRAIIRAGRLHAPACDDLAALASAVSAFEEMLKQRKDPADVRLLCTRAEEIGFIGAIAACKSGILPKGSRIVALENSKSFAESPIGGGPIVRVGDRTATFDPALTYLVGQVAKHLATQGSGYAWQRRLMPGGTCEASAYQSLGYTATCICLPLGNYHNMDEDKGVIARETIALSDYHGMTRLLVAIGTHLDDHGIAEPFAPLLKRLFTRHASLLDGGPLA